MRLRNVPAAPSRGAPAPEALRRDLRAHAGEAPVPDTIRVGRATMAVGPLLAIARTEGAEDVDTIGWAVAALAEWDEGSGAARSLWPFASNTGDGLFCLDLSAAGEPPIVFVDLADGAGPPHGTVPVADSYSAMLEGLVHDG